MAGLVLLGILVALLEAEDWGFRQLNRGPSGDGEVLLLWFGAWVLLGLAGGAAFLSARRSPLIPGIPAVALGLATVLLAVGLLTSWRPGPVLGPLWEWALFRANPGITVGIAVLMVVATGTGWWDRRARVQHLR